MRITLSAPQIAAAVAIRRQLVAWNVADQALGRLAEDMPGFDSTATLLKVAAINQLYGTNLYAVPRMAEHIVQVMLGKKPRVTPELVERIACVPAPSGQREWRHFSFASKFCNRFIDREACPMMDSYATWTLRHHLGRSRAIDAQHPYLTFVVNIQRLSREAGLSASASELDSYLWIRGAFDAWWRDRSRDMNGELKAFFVDHHRGRLMKRLVGEH